MASFCYLYGTATNSLSFTESNGTVSQRYSFAKGDLIVRRSMSCERSSVAYQFALLAPPVRRKIVDRIVGMAQIGAVSNPSEEDDAEDVIAIL